MNTKNYWISYHKINVKWSLNPINAYNKHFKKPAQKTHYILDILRNFKIEMRENFHKSIISPIIKLLIFYFEKLLIDKRMSIGHFSTSLHVNNCMMSFFNHPNSIHKKRLANLGHPNVASERLERILNFFKNIQFCQVNIINI